MDGTFSRRRALAVVTGTGLAGGGAALFRGREDDAEPVRAPRLVVEPRFDVAGRTAGCRLDDDDVKVWFVHGGGAAVSASDLVVMERYGTPSVTVGDCDDVDGTFEAGDGVVVAVGSNATVRFAYSPGGTPVSDASEFATLTTARFENGEAVTE
jgi:hypothetical protein